MVGDDELAMDGSQVHTDINGNGNAGRSIALQSDGKILVAGYVGGATADFALVRYDAAGTPDPSFGTNGNGRVVTPVGNGTDDYGYSVAVQSDGKILVAGEVAGANANIGLVRCNTDGRLDTSFGVGGIVITDVNGNSNGGRGLALQGDGKILVAGYVGGATADFVLVRYDAAGTPDPSFGTNGNGRVVTPVGNGTDDYGYGVAVQNDGKIVVAGEVGGANSNIGLVRYNTNGLLDVNFGTEGIVITDVNGNSNRGESVALQSDGKILVAGYVGGATADFALVRYTKEGAPDAGFGDSGRVVTGFGRNSDDFAYSIAVQTDGKILLAGEGSYGTNPDFAVARFLGDDLLQETGATAPVVNPQTGLAEQSVTVTNFSDFATGGVRLRIAGLPAGVSVVDGTYSGGNYWLVEYDTLLHVTQNAVLSLRYSFASGPVTFTPTVTVEPPPATLPAAEPAFGKAIRSLVRDPVSGNVTVKFGSQPGRAYLVEFSPDLVTPWDLATGSIFAHSSAISWLDDGIFIGTAPRSVGKRFYRIRDITP